MKNILLVEDNPLIIHALTFRLKKDGYSVINAKNGKEALKLLKKNKFDLLVTDLIMPDLRGEELIRFIINHEYQIPCMVISSIKEETTITELFELGIVDYIIKPFKPQEIAIRIRRSLSA